MHSNHLISEKSPYLLQHAHNPVDWYPWGHEAFERAKTENKPIFLSIGYSTCHWCHVMERESFENEAIAKYLGEHFISIKVDREERPDVDAIYMSATQAMTGSGGWPMTCFLTPELKPFFCGTYFPPVPSHGRPSFGQLLERIVELWQTRRDDIVGSADELTKAIHEMRLEAPTSASLELAVESCLDYFKRSFDEREGGFGGAPKFPRPVQFEFLFQHYATSGDLDARNMALFTLKKMAMGGMNDQIAGGFHRYSVDGRWFAPHFEKMLYDQAQLLDSYLDAYQITKDEFYADVARSIADFVLSDMTHPAGAFYSALDADSEGVEGKYYVWTLDEIERIVGKVDAELFAMRFGVTSIGNWENGENILYRAATTPDVAKQFGIETAEVRKRLAASARMLLAERKKRIPPHLDDKILTSWNGLMIGALARAADVLHDALYLQAAERAAEFIWSELFENVGGQLLHRWREGEARFEGYLESYAYLIKGYLRLYEHSFDSKWLDRTITLQQQQDAVFFDAKLGGYFSSREQSDLILRTKNDYDGAEPSGNSVAVENLYRLFTITAKAEYRERAELTIAAFSGRLAQYPYTMPSLLAAATWQLRPAAEIVVSGSLSTTAYRATRSMLATYYLPHTVMMYATAENKHLADFAQNLAGNDGTFTIYYCHRQVCELPVHSAVELESLLPKLEQ